MTIADILRVCPGLDQQCVSPRPSPWGRMAEIVTELAARAEEMSPDMEIRVEAKAKEAAHA